MEITTALDVLTALSNETRLWAFRLVVQAGSEGLSAGDIADNLNARQNTMSSHLRLLQQSGLIRSRRDGRSVIYSVNYDTVRQLVVFLMLECCAGNTAVCQPVADSLLQAGCREPMATAQCSDDRN
jgi:ArsR family transcriptional regulator, arsenate/arsenite/antimonite-responsive transcriptional repressor